jgi:hypothetical protein
LISADEALAVTEQWRDVAEADPSVGKSSMSRTSSVSQWPFDAI